MFAAPSVDVVSVHPDEAAGSLISAATTKKFKKVIFTG